MSIRYIKFRLADLQDKYTALVPGGPWDNFPSVGALAYRVANFLKRQGIEARVYKCACNGLVWRVKADSVSPEATFCVWVWDILAPVEAAQYEAEHDERIQLADWPLRADYLIDDGQ